MSKKYFIFLLSLIPFIVSAQTWEWAKSYETPNTKLVDHSQSISKDGNDNFYITGFSRQPGGGGSAGWAYNWLKKFDVQGNFIWSDTIPFYTPITKNVTDVEGNTYVVGNGKIVKYNTNGVQLWDISARIDFNNLAFSNRGVVVTGYTWSYPATMGGYNIPSETGVIVECDEKGNLLWLRQLNNYGPSSISISPIGLIYISGSASANGDSTCVKIIDRDGNYMQGSLKFKYPINHIAVDSKNNFYISSDINKWMPLILGDDTIVCNCDRSFSQYLVKYDSDGNYQWHEIIKENVDVSNLIIDNEDNVYIGGNILKTLQIDSFLLDNVGGSIYAAKFKPDGTVSWIEYSEQATPRGSGQLNQMVLDSDNNLVIAGAITDKHIFGDITVTGTDNLYADVLIAKIKQEKVIGVNETQFIISNGLNVYPNPTDGLFTAFYRSEKSSALTLKIINQLGQVILIKNYPEQKEISETFDLSSFAKGMYLIQVKTNETTEVKKIILK